MMFPGDLISRLLLILQLGSQITANHLMSVTYLPSLVRNSGVLNIPISDHLPVFATLKLKPPKKPPCYVAVRSSKHYDPSSFTYDLAANSDRLLSIFSVKDMNTKLTSFNLMIFFTPLLTCMHQARPLRFAADHAHMLQPKLKNL